MSWFWKTVSRMDVRLLAVLSVACTLGLLAWRGIFDLDQNHHEQPLPDTSADHAERSALAVLTTQPEPELKKNPFMSSYLEHLRAVAKEKRELEMAQRKAEVDARRAEEEAARRAAEAESSRKAEEVGNDGVQDQSAAEKEVLDTSAVSQTNALPSVMTLLYKGMLVRTDGVRLALIALNGEEGYYPEGQTLKWITIQTFSRDALELRLGDESVILQRGQPFSIEEP